MNPDEPYLSTVHGDDHVSHHRHHPLAPVRRAGLMVVVIGLIIQHYGVITVGLHLGR